MKSIPKSACKHKTYDEIRAGGRLSNTHLGSSEEKIEIRQGGEDTLHLGLGVAWGAEFQELRQKLDEAKQQAQSGQDCVVLTLGDLPFLVESHGNKSGGGRGTYYSWVLCTAGYTLKLQNLSEPYESTPNVMVEIGAVELLQVGDSANALEVVKKIIAEIGGIVLWDKVSRVDVCADLLGVPVSEYCLLLLGEQYICRARSFSVHGERPRMTGLVLGKGAIVMRIYDKLYEVTIAKPDPTKHALLKLLRWGKRLTRLRVSSFNCVGKPCVIWASIPWRIGCGCVPQFCIIS